MSNEFDFRIKQSVYVQALDTYKRAEERLAEEREAQKSNMSYMRNNISGSSSDALEIATSSFFSPYGAYDKAWAQVKCMREMLEETLPEINALMARCEEFPEQLQSDSYIEPIRPAEGNNTSRNGDILSLNYDKVAVIKDTCDQIAELGQEIGSELESIMESCEGVLGDLSDEIEEVRAATRKIKRVLNFKDSFQKYEAGIKALEFDMILMLKTLSGDADIYAEQLNMSKEEFIKNIELLESATELLAGYAQIYGEETYDRAVALLVCDEKGKYAFEEVLQSESISEADEIALANVYDMLFAKVELAEEEGSILQEKAILEKYLESLYQIETVDKYMTNTGLPYTVSYVSANDKMIERLSNRITGENTLAKQTLENLQGDKMEILGAWFKEMGLFDMSVSKVTELYQTQLVDVDMKFTDLGIVLDIMACPKASGRDVVPDSGKESYRVNGINKTERYVCALGETVLGRMEGLGYSTDDIVQMYMLTENEKDVEFLGEIVKGNYKEAFNVPIEALGENTKMNLGYYSVRLGELLESGNTELQNFVNGILYVDENRCYNTGYLPENYLELLTVQTGAIRECYTAQLFAGVEGEEARKYSRVISHMYSLWNALYMEMEKGDIKAGDYYNNKWYSRGECGVQISGLGLSEITVKGEKIKGENICFDMNLLDNENQDVIATMKMSTEIAWSPDETHGDYGLKERKELLQEIDNLWAKQSIETMYGLAKIYYPGITDVVDLGISVIEGKASDISSNIKSQSINGKEVSKEGKCVLDVISGITGYMEARKALEEEYSNSVHEDMLSWFYSANEYYAGGECTYLEDGIYNYDVIQGIRKWDEEGIEYIIHDNEIVNTNNSLYDNIKALPQGGFFNYSEEKKNALVYLIYGNSAVQVEGYTGEYQSILEIPGDIFTELVEEIDAVMKHVNDKNINLQWKETMYE